MVHHEHHRGLRVQPASDCGRHNQPHAVDRTRQRSSSQPVADAEVHVGVESRHDLRVRRRAPAASIAPSTPVGGRRARHRLQHLRVPGGRSSPAGAFELRQLDDVQPHADLVDHALWWPTYQRSPAAAASRARPAAPPQQQRTPTAVMRSTASWPPRLCRSRDATAAPRPRTARALQHSRTAPVHQHAHQRVSTSGMANMPAMLNCSRTAGCGCPARPWRRRTPPTMAPTSA